MTVPLLPSHHESPGRGRRLTFSQSPSQHDSPGRGRRLTVPQSPSHHDSPGRGRRPTVPQSPSQHEFLDVDDGFSSVRVAVRTRPLVEKELAENCIECISYAQDGKQVVVGKDRRFTFDHVFCPEVSQEDVYKECVKPLVDSCCSGYTATVLAYGQTGSGKTFTMGCGNNVSLLDEELGILPRAIRQLFECVEERSNQAEFLIKCAFVEIYNEDIKDLLHPDTPSKSISICEDANGDIVLAGVKEEVVTNFESMIKFLKHGSAFRTTGSTLMNQHSSRSHAIFTIIVEQRSIIECAISNDVITSKFHLVDLAGSERAKRTGAVGMRFKESVTINCGLLALGNVISALGDERKRCLHVPYRESKLTRMLQDSLGGNSRTCMIACISAAGSSFEETLSTLKYANRARNIRNKPVINLDPQSVKLNQLRQEIRALQLELLNSRMRNMELEPVSRRVSLEAQLEDQSHKGARADISVHVTAELNNEHQKCREWEHECHVLKDEIQALQSVVSRMEEEIIEMRTERDHAQLKLDEVNLEMMALMQVLPHWEGGNDVSPVVKGHLSEMMKRVTGEIDNEGTVFGSSESSFSSLDSLVTADAATIRSKEVLSPVTTKDSFRERINSSNSRPQSQSEDCQDLASMRDFMSSPTNADARSMKSNSSGRDNRNIINQHLRTIRVLEERLAVKESDVTSKDEALKEAAEDLERDERIFAEKMQEIKALKKLAQDEINEKEALVQKNEKDAAVISRMLEEGLAKEDELARLRTALETLQSGHPDAFAVNVACVPGVPVALMKSNGDAVHVDNIEKFDEAKCESLENACDGVDSVGQAPLEDLSEKVQEEEKPTLQFEKEATFLFEKKAKFLFEKKAIEDHKHRLEEDVQVQSREVKRTKQKGNFFTKCLMGL